jgi:MAF protein
MAAGGELILGSSSPRRRLLLERLGLPFSVHSPDVDETALPDESPTDLAVRLARLKAQAIVPQAPGALVLAADTVVVLGDVVLGKPRDAEEAIGMLARLRGRQHRVVTGVCLLGPDGLSRTRRAATAVWMRPYTPEEVKRYANTGQPLDKAGAYGIQDRPFCPVRAIRGCYTNVVGLPLCLVVALLAEAGRSTAPAAVICPHRDGRTDPRVAAAQLDATAG